MQLILGLTVEETVWCGWGLQQTEETQPGPRTEEIQATSRCGFQGEIQILSLYL